MFALNLPLMAGLYIHIPFCKQACFYCDFHFSTNQSQKAEMVLAIARELELQKDYLQGEVLDTVYLGGGTPSLLTGQQLNFLLERVSTLFSLASLPEITLEANPDDITKERLGDLKRAGVNRLSIGVQSFDDRVLKFFNRAHHAQQAEDAFYKAREAGFDNISIDLIYAIPKETPAQWLQNIETALRLNPEHLSAYSLTIEDKTVFGHQKKKGLLKPLPETEAVQNFEVLMETLKDAGYWHYEISNFCRPDRISRHNTNYWKQQKYLGVGPSAHSYDGDSRQWNIANNQHYLKKIAEGNVPFEKETLTRVNKINEYVFTSLRTMWGCDIWRLQNEWSFYVHKLPAFSKLLKTGLLYEEGHFIKLTQKGKLLADQVALDLFIDDDS